MVHQFLDKMDLMKPLLQGLKVPAKSFYRCMSNDQCIPVHQFLEKIDLMKPLLQGLRVPVKTFYPYMSNHQCIPWFINS